MESALPSLFTSWRVHYLHYSCHKECTTFTELFKSRKVPHLQWVIHVTVSTGETLNHSCHSQCRRDTEPFMSQWVQERHWTIHVTENALPSSILGICPWLHGYPHQVSSAWWRTAIFCFGPSWPWPVRSQCRKEWCGKRWSTCNSRQKKMYTLLAKCRQY